MHLNLVVPKERKRVNLTMLLHSSAHIIRLTFAFGRRVSNILQQLLQRTERFHDFMFSLLYGKTYFLSSVEKF